MPTEINNQIYHDLGKRWYTASDDPVALLRAESKLRNPWVEEKIKAHFDGRGCQVLDIGCGAGFLSNFLAKAGHRVTGVDLSQESLAIARQYDSTSQVSYRMMDATQLDFEDQLFDVVCAMDFLEHVPDPKGVVCSAARVLKPGGIFFFHTFNRNLLSYVIAIKGVEWFVKNTPKNMHIYKYFITPLETKSYCEENGLQVLEMKGVIPRLNTAFFQLLIRGEVDDTFQFIFSDKTWIGYTGFAVKRGGP